MYNATLRMQNGSSKELECAVSAQTVTLRKSQIPAGTESLDLFPELFRTEAGSGGFFMVPTVNNNENAGQIFFSDREDTEEIFQYNGMPIYLFHNGTSATLAVVSGMEMDYVLVTGVKNGIYYMFPRFQLNGEEVNEDITVTFFELTGADASWCGAARRYRQYQLDRKACRTLRERAGAYPAVKEAALGPEVRVRLAWKPVPSPVPEQTLETEPPVHVAITFEQCGEILDEFHRQGIEHAEFCLVGWNKSGHDGRFPDLFPVEPLLGGEEALIRLTEKAKKYGYLITGHTNLLDSYRIASRWTEEICLKDKDGSLHQEGFWGGGNSYYLCPQRAHEAFAEEDMRDLKRLGFYGLHYFDVMSIARPCKCYDERHPLTRKQSGAWRGKTLALAREKIGGSGSEGAWDFCIDDLDYVLYTAFHRTCESKLIDRLIPFWHIVYHGIVLYNTFSDTVNACIKSDRSLPLLNLSWGGRPAFYFYAKFLTTGVNWMGDEDLCFTTHEQLTKDVAEIRRDYDRYSSVCDLQYEFINEISEPAPGITQTTYSNGTVLIFNTGNEDYTFEGRSCKPLEMLRIDK